jgi:hypothetical protein
MTTVFLVSLSFLVLFLLLAGYHNEQTILEQWDIVLNPEGHQSYSLAADKSAWGHRMAQITYDDAAKAHANGNLAEALRLLDLGSRVVGDCATDTMALLRGVATLAGYAEAIAPMAPLRPAAFHGRQLATLAGLHQLGHHLLITTRERLHLRLAVLRCGVRAGGWLVARATWGVQKDIGDPRRWRHVDAARGDLGLLTDEALSSLRVVLASLAAVRRPAPAKETA